MLPRALIVTTIVTLALAAAIAHATSPGKNGRLAFMVKDSKGHWQIWVAGPRLGGAKKLTTGPADSGWPVWSPDGKKLAFDSNRTDPNPTDSTAVNDLFTINADGSGVTKLTDSVGASADAAWSPDGSLIAFDADRGDPNSKQGIYTMRSDGSDFHRVTIRPPGYEFDVSPRFSPDGKRLVFTRFRGKGCPQPYCPSEHAALFTVALDGTGLRRLTTFAIHAGDADWSPDGKRIVFEAYPNGPSATSTSSERTGGISETSRAIPSDRRAPRTRCGLPTEPRSSSSTSVASTESGGSVSRRSDRTARRAASSHPGTSKSTNPTGSQLTEASVRRHSGTLAQASD